MVKNESSRVILTKAILSKNNLNGKGYDMFTADNFITG